MSDHLRAENERLLARVEQLEDALGCKIEAPTVLKLTRYEAKVFGVLMKREMAHHEQIKAALYQATFSGQLEPDSRVIGVFICNIRRKLKPFGITIDSVWGGGYRLTPEAKAKVRALFEREAVAA